MISLYNAIAERLNRADWLLSTLARFVFAATLLVYFWVSGLTKLGEGFAGLFSPSVGAYAQIFPRVMEAVTYDTSQLGIYHWAVVVSGTWAEFILPALIVLGLLTRLSALGMIFFVILQSITDVVGHGTWAGEIVNDTWFDRFNNGVIMDQRAFWIFVLVVLVIKGAGPFSLDRALKPRPR